MHLPAIESIPTAELEARHQRCRDILARRLPHAAGILALHPVTIYYLGGTLGNGVLWLPLQGNPVLLCRKGVERARLESTVPHVLPFRSYSDLPPLLAEAGSPLPEQGSEAVAVEMGGISWSLGSLLASRLKGLSLVPGDNVLSETRAVKTPWELAKLRLAGERHHRGLHELLPTLIAPGMNERQIAHKAWEVFFSLGHAGLMRMSGSAEEIFLGHVSAGESANYPSRYNGPVGLMGEHPAVPFMGYAGKVWLEHEPLTCDIGFCLEGYQTDKTQVYWSGSRGSLPGAVAGAHDFCVEVQEFLAGELKPGAVPSRLYAEARQRAEKAGYQEGFMGLGDNKVPFLGHGIGLQIDEYPVLAKGFDEPLAEGMVLALEPKLGIPGVGMVGVENTFEVTAAGGRCLTGDRYEILCLG